MDTQLTISWPDALKLTVPAVTPFVLFFISGWYNRKQEMQTKAESVRRSIVETSPNLPAALGALDIIANDLKNGKVTIVHFDIPVTTTTLAARLAELDTCNSYVYSQYTSFAEISRNGAGLLLELLKAVAISPTVSVPLQQAVESQIKALKGDFIILAEQEVLVLKALATIISFDPQVISASQSAISSARKLLK
ncbi:MAG TPA: hypothetical protein VI298_16855 [Geobacteraceae bacterium]